MIISVDEICDLVKFPESWTDIKIEHKLKAIEQTIRAYTNNNFQVRGYRTTAEITGGRFVTSCPVPFKPAETVQVSDSALNSGLYVINSISDTGFTTVESVVPESHVLVTKVKYPADVIDCAVNLITWEVNNRDKVGIQSETLSRHSVTYFSMDGDNSSMGYPKSLLGPLNAYRKARI